MNGWLDGVYDDDDVVWASLKREIFSREIKCWLNVIDLYDCVCISALRTSSSLLPTRFIMFAQFKGSSRGRLPFNFFNKLLFCLIISLIGFSIIRLRNV